MERSLGDRASLDGGRRNDDVSWTVTARADCLSSVSSGAQPAQSTGTLLGVGLPAEFARTLTNQGSVAGYRCCFVDSVESLTAMSHPAGFTVAALFLDIDPSLQMLGNLRRICQQTPVVAITDSPSLLHASAAIRAGAHAVLARPTAFGQILAALGSYDVTTLVPMSLDRAIWEYLNQVVIEAKSIAGAARRLRIDRTSLKRMLRKRPPEW